MVWTLKSDKTGQEYDFEDGVAPAEALKWMDSIAEPDQKWSNTFETIPRAVQTGLLKAQAGAAKFGEDYIVKPAQRTVEGLMNPLDALRGKSVEPAGSEFTEAQDAKYRAASGLLKKETEGVPNLTQKAVSSAAVSLAEQTPELLTGAGVAMQMTKAGVALGKAVGTVAELALGGAAAREGSREYLDQRAAGKAPGPAFGAATVQAVAEYLPEKFAWTPVMKLLKTPDAGIRQAVTSLIFRDMVGENITTTAQWLNRKLTRDPETTLGDLVEELKVTTLSAGISGPVQGATARAAYGLALREQMAAEEKGESPRREPTIIDTEPAPDAPPTDPTFIERERGKGGRLTIDSELPLVGQPGEMQNSSRELPPEQKLELLRTAYAAYQNRSAFDTAEERIQRRSEFFRRRSEFEQSLQFDPEARAFLRTADAELGVTVPTTATAIEDEMYSYANLTPRQREELRLAREEDNEPESTTEPAGVPVGIRKALGIGPSFSNDGIDKPNDRGDFSSAQIASERAQYFDNTVAAQGPAHLVRKTFAEVEASIRPGDVVYVTKPDASGRPVDVNTHAASLVTQILGDLAKTYLPGKHIFIGRVIDGVSFNSHAMPFGKDGYALSLSGLQGKNTKNTFFSRLVNKFTVDADTTAIVETALHEFTHFLHMEHWKNTPASEKAAVAAEYHADLQRAVDGTIGEWLAAVAGPKVASKLQNLYELAGGEMSDKMLNNPLAQQVFPHFKDPGYWYNFNEWIANKGSRYFATRLGVRKENVAFFKRWLLKMRQLYTDLVTQYFEPGPGFSQWLDNVAARESGMDGVLSVEEMSAAKAELVRGGLDPVVADMLQTVRGFNTQRVREDAQDAATRMPPDPLALSQVFSELDSAINATTFDGIVSALKSFKFARDLAKGPVFANATLRNRAHFLEAVAMLSFGKKVQSLKSASWDMWIYEGPGMMAVRAEYDKSTKQLYIGENEYGYDGAALVVASKALRDLAQSGVNEIRVDGLSPGLKRALGLKSNAVRMQVPYWSYQPVVTPPQDTAEQGTAVLPEMRMPAALHSLGTKFNLPFLQSTSHSLARFNSFFSKALGSYQLIKMNEHVPGMVEEKTALRNRMAYRHKWLKRADATVQKWAFDMPKTEASKLAKLLYDEAESGKWLSTISYGPAGERIFTVAPQEASRRGLSPKTLEVYSQVRQDFMLFADEWHKVGLWEIARNEMSDVAQHALSEAMRSGVTMTEYQKVFNLATAAIQDPSKQARVVKRKDALNTEFDSWKSKPYMPYTRFGRYGVLVRDGQTGDTLYFAGYETQAEQALAAAEVKNDPRFAGHATSQTYLEDVPYMFAGLPPSMLDAMKHRLNLTKTQEQEFSDVMAKLSHANSFVHRAQRKAGIEGYSVDALRAYSDYFRRGSAYIARIKSQVEMDDALNLLKKHINAQTKVGADVTKEGRLHEWFVRLHTYLNEPGNEHGEVKSFIALWHFGFNVATAATNLTQVAIATLPYLSERYGTAKATAELGRAYKDALAMYTKQAQVAPDELAMLEHALEAGFRDESQATVIAQIADGAALARVTPMSAFHRATNTMNHYAMWMFSKGELLNRDVTLLAAYRLSKKATFHGKFDRDAYDFARTTVEDTHNEYAQENRPEIMRGAGGVVFQFMHYVQNMLFLHFGGDKSWWRLGLVQMTVAGLTGMPFAKDMLAAAKFIGRRVFGEDWDAELEARKYLVEVGANPDYFLRGLAGDVFGFDLSQRTSLGDIIPGMQAVGSHRKMEDLMYSAVGDAGGPAVSLVMNAFKFMSEEDKLTWDALKGIMPTAVRSVGNATKAFVSGKATDRGGATIFEPDMADIIGMSFGYMPKELSQHYQARTMQSEKAAYWITRRNSILEMYKHIALAREFDREGMADFMDRLEVYNKEIPEPALRVTAKTLRNSLTAQLQANAKKEAGLGSNPQLQQSSAEITSTFDSPAR